MILLMQSVANSEPKKKTIDIQPKKNICFTREESEDIFKCLEMRKYFEDAQYAAPIFNADSEEKFLNTPQGQIVLFGTGILAGFFIGKSVIK